MKRVLAVVSGVVAMAGVATATPPGAADGQPECRSGRAELRSQALPTTMWHSVDFIHSWVVQAAVGRLETVPLQHPEVW